MEPFFRRPVRDFIFEKKPAASRNPYEHAIQLLEKGELANAIVILQGITQKTACDHCRKEIEETITPSIQRYEVERAKKLIKVQ